MSKKTELSDDQLDLLSGGVLTYQGSSVSEFGKVTGWGVEVKTSDGWMQFPWNDKARKEFPGFFGGTDGGKLIFSKSMTFDRIALEDYTGDPTPIAKE